MGRIYPLLCVIALVWLCACSFALASKASAGSAAVPRAKNNGGPLAFLSNRLIDRVIREVKSSFSSDLEALTLQMTRPSNAAIPLSSLDLLVSIINSEYADPELLVGLLAKLSRKFAEPHVCTQLKALHALLAVAFKTEDKPRLAWSRATCSMQGELDSKVGRPFFSLESLASSKATTAQELAGTKLARLFADHTFQALQLLGDKTLSPRQASGAAPLPHRTIKSLVALYNQGSNVSQLAAQIDTPLSRQIAEMADTASMWAVQRLHDAYENGLVADPLCEAVEVVLRSRGIPFPVRSAHDSKDLPASTSKPPAIPAALRQSVARSVGAMAAQRSSENGSSNEGREDRSPTSLPTSQRKESGPRAAGAEPGTVPKPKPRPRPASRSSPLRSSRSVSKPNRPHTTETEPAQMKGKSQSSPREKRSKKP